jgi:hypothetical protein
VLRSRVTKRHPAPRRALPTWLADPLRLSIHLVRRLFEKTMLALFVALLVRYGLQFQHPAKWETWRVTGYLRAGTDPAPPV